MLDILATLRAAPGQVIDLPAGDYGAVTFPPGLDCKGAILRGSPGAILRKLDAPGLANLTLANIEFAGVVPAPLNQQLVTLSGSTNVTLDTCPIHGDMQATRGIGAGSSHGLKVINCELFSLLNGMGLMGADGASITNTRFHDIRVDGLDILSGTNTTVDACLFNDFHHLGQVGQGGDHSDAIQVWTLLGKPSANYRITNCVIFQGLGRDFQGIFFGPPTPMPHQHVTIDNNIIIGGNWNSIFVNAGDDITVTNNLVLCTVGHVNFIHIDPSCTRVTNTGNQIIKLDPAGAYAQLMKLTTGA